MTRQSWGLVPVGLLGAGIAVLRLVADPSVFYDPGWLLTFTNVVFITLIDVVVAVRALRSFTAVGGVQVLLLGCATLVFGLASAGAGFARGLPDGANLAVTIHNIGALAAAHVYGISALILMAGLSPAVAQSRRRAIVAIGCLAAVAVAVSVTLAAVGGATWPFFVQGEGPTPVRQAVLGAATILFGFAAVVFVATHIRTRERFLYWYALALALMCVGLVAIFMESSVGSPVSWAGRVAQYLGGIYLLIALQAAQADARDRRASPDKVLTFSLGSGAGGPPPVGADPYGILDRLDEDTRRIYLEASSDAFFVKDADGRYRLVNTEASRVTGKDPADVIGNDDTFLFPPDQAALVMAADRLVLQTGRITTSEDVIDTVAGPRTYLTTRGPLYGAHETVVGLFGIARDITESKRAEAAIRASEQRYRALFESASDALFVIDMATTRILDANGMASAIYGYDHDELLTMTSSDVSAEPDETERRTHEAQDTPDQVLTIPQRQHRRKDGTVFPVEITARNTEWHDQRVLLVASRDITRRQAAEDALRASEERLKLLRDSSGDSIYSFDLEGRFTSANRHFCQTLGLSEEQVIGRTPPEVGLPIDRFAELATVHMEVIRFDRSIVLEVEMPMPDGQVRAAEISMNPIHDRAGHVTGISETSRDITERKTAAEAIRKMALLLDAAPNSITVHDFQGRFLYANPKTFSLHGYTSDEFLALSLADVDVPADAALIASRMDELRAHGEVSFDVEHRRKDGSILPLAVTVTHTTWGNEPAILSVATDITERKAAQAVQAALQAQLGQAQKMESVGRLAGGVAHDFNNMLGSILGNAELALEALGPSHPVEAQLKEILEASRRSADLTRQLLAFARRETVAPKVLNVNEAVVGVLKMMERIVGEGVTLTWTPGDDLWPVRIDPTQLDQILANLVVNARDAVGGSGLVTVTTGKATLDEGFCATRPDAQPGDYTILTVADNGVGMGAETLSHLFEPFFTTKAAGAGTGLGLATVYGIVRQNGGVVDVASEVGVGSVFQVYLPRHAGRPVAADGAAPVTARLGGGETILLVEDEPALLRLGTVMLGRLGYQVIPAATPGEAIRLARESEFEIHLLITDVVMPEMNGRDLARNLQALYPHLARLFMSGYTADVIAHHGVLDDGVHFLQKPFSTEDLAAKVREALGAERRR